MQGIPASAGVAIGTAVVVLGRQGKVARSQVPPERIEEEIERFHSARAATRAHLEAIREQVASGVGREYVGIIESHLLLLDDPVLVEDTVQRVRERREIVEYAYARVTRHIIKSFAALDDPYFKERSTDVLDVRERVLHELLGLTPPDLTELSEPVIVVAEQLTPSMTLTLPREKVLGFATASGGKGAHAALLARSMEIPAVVGVRGLMDEVEVGMTLALDGHAGSVIIEPDTQQRREFGKRRKRFRDFVQGLESLRDHDASTLDGHRVQLAANIEYPEEVESVVSHGARGIGLYRTEFLFLELGSDPLESEEMQYKSYVEVARAIHPDPVVIRTFDMGGDKLADSPFAPESNPFLGYRAIRICLGNHALFRTQLRALLRAAAVGNVHILFPMISGISEVLQAKEVLESVKDELRSEGIEFGENPPIGVMIEVPSAALCAERLAAEVDFFSVGTNDLTQYTLAVDRNNALVDYLYQPLHPAVLRLLGMVVDAARAKERHVGICGELAGDPLATLVLLGMGFDSLSTNLMVLPEIKQVIRSVTLSEAKAVAGKVAELGSAAEIEAYLKALAEERFPRLEI